MRILACSLVFLAPFISADWPRAKTWRTAESANGTAVDAKPIRDAEFNAADALSFHTSASIRGAKKNGPPMWISKISQPSPSSSIAALPASPPRARPEGRDGEKDRMATYHPDRRRSQYPLPTTIERRGGDSNPRYGRPHTGFRNQLLQPLGHLSKIDIRSS